MAEEKNEFMTYKGRPLVRSKKILYYGDMRDPYVVMLQITDTKETEVLTFSKSRPCFVPAVPQSGKRPGKA